MNTITLKSGTHTIKLTASGSATRGPAGQGIADGGTPGQFLIKLSNTDYDTAWHTLELDDIGLPNLNSSFAANPDSLIFGTIVRDANDAVLSAPVIWPDGVVGEYTATELSDDYPGAVDAYEITYEGDVTVTYTQPTVTRNSNGAVINRPAIEVT